MSLTRELRRKLDELAIECEDTYSMANRTEDMLEEIFNDHETQLKAKDEEIERLKKAIDTSIEEIEYAIKKPQYAEVYLGNAIRFLKDNA